MTTPTSGASGGARRAGTSRADLAKDRKFLAPSGALRSGNPWHALWAMMIGFFMIMVDSTIVAIANPTIMADLHIGYDAVVWVTSAYLLGYAVVLLVAGRLGDRFGSKNLYLIGLVAFTAASMWCGLAGSAAMLIAARVVQGIGAGVLTPQTLSTITRIFPPQRRGVAVSVWGATAGVASLVGPLAGGVLVDGLGWEWIFFVNVPIGIAGLALAVWLVPELPTQAHRFDLVGVGLSAVGVFLIVFGLQQGQAAGWQPWIWATIVAGAGFVSAFVYWQSVNTREPLIPLDVFADRDFTLCSVGVAITSFASTAMMLPLTFYTQTVCGLSPTRSALLIAPMAIANGVLAPFVGRIVDRYHPRPVLGFGFSVLAISLTWLSFEMGPDTPIWRLVLPFTAIGVGMAFVWSPLTATATRNLPPQLAGTGSAVYNSVRQLGAVLGSAAMAAFMTWRIGAEMPRGASSQDAGDGAIPLQLPEFLREPFSAAMSQSVLLPAFIALFGIGTALFLVGFAPSVMSRAGIGGVASGPDEPDDDDDYVEVILRREPSSEPGTAAKIAPVEARPAPIGFAHNGSRVEREKRIRPVVELPPHLSGPASRNRRGAPSPGRRTTGSPRRRLDPDEDPTGRSPGR
ncbi:MDR family MFS transporter [Mycobacterium sp. Aquia_216]|uniref:MDR family MFS transporter n=1 Tax=Mycobacterium sp. Aquia_216 TaxID=2991729 RepID=UPI00227A343C|nr:MDR family MFS transporter [Mycobacterium sp. Aquia_216]WAJ43995.1 MDR family MFS transporter [Mycobacterium sp. Aquia_216]